MAEKQVPALDVEARRRGGTTARNDFKDEKRPGFRIMETNEVDHRRFHARTCPLEDVDEVHSALRTFALLRQYPCDGVLRSRRGEIFWNAGRAANNRGRPCP